ncbi:MAG: hypothetical protein FWD01_01675 [Defluviitaleaceae bacterium]|nr:hypothetical protein [Defluviitaleaceae bacterium]
MTRSEYWKYPDKIQSQVYRLTRSRINALSAEISSVLSDYLSLNEVLTHSQVKRLHQKMDEWNEFEYYGSRELAAQAQYFRRHRRIQNTDALNLAVAAAFIFAYSKLLNAAGELYAGVFKQKYFELTRRDFRGIIPYKYTTVLPTGISMLTMLFNEAIYRAKRMAQTIIRLSPEDNFDGMDEPLIQKELERAKNALLKESVGGGYHGILDTIMVFCIGYAIMRALGELGGKFEFHAVMDNRTTDLCAYLNGKIFKASEAVLGVNVPPITVEVSHNCRSWIEII